MGEKALRALEKAILKGFVVGSYKRPGAIIEQLTQEDRDKLKELTSDDTKNQRWIK